MTNEQRQEDAAKKVLQLMQGGLSGVVEFKMIEYPSGVFWYAACFPAELWDFTQRGELKRKAKTKPEQTA